MTPGARIAAAIGLLDRIIEGAPAERELTRWARASRYAGSKDRAALRDLVFDALRHLRSYGALGGGANGRALMLGREVAAGRDPGAVFNGARFAPAPPGPGELPGLRREDLPELIGLDVPDWLAPDLRASLGAQFVGTMRAMQSRAPVFLRVNTARTTSAQVREILKQDGIGAIPAPLADTALEVVENPRRISASRAYRDGLVELQDVASQAVCAALPKAARVLDYCAGGGGKALALAARGARVWAHDAAPERLRDLPSRAARAGVEIPPLSREEARARAPWELVVTDVPCSGSGTWRRSPQSRWNLTPQRLRDLVQIQAAILDETAPLVAPDGHLAYITCSLLDAENSDQIDTFLTRHPGWKCTRMHRFTPLDGGDGLFLALLTR